MGNIRVWRTVFEYIAVDGETSDECYAARRCSRLCSTGVRRSGRCSAPATARCPNTRWTSGSVCSSSTARCPRRRRPSSPSSSAAAPTTRRMRAALCSIVAALSCALLLYCDCCLVSFRAFRSSYLLPLISSLFFDGLMLKLQYFLYIVFHLRQLFCENNFANLFCQ